MNALTKIVFYTYGAVTEAGNIFWLDLLCVHSIYVLVLCVHSSRVLCVLGFSVVMFKSRVNGK